MTRRGPTQRDRVLDALRARGAEGIGPVDFLAPDVIDGLPPILRLPSRIDDLRQSGARIVTLTRPDRTARYVLHAEPPPPVSPTTRAARPRPAPDGSPALRAYLAHRAEVDEHEPPPAAPPPATLPLFELSEDAA